MTDEPWNKWVKKNPLRAYRAKVGATQARVANALRVTPQIIRLWETGSSTPNAINFPKIAKLLFTDEKKLRGAWKRWVIKCPA